MPAKNYFITGVTELLFLSMLSRGDSYVYDITKTIEDYSGGQLQISPNTIYTVAYKLEQEKYISEYSKLVGRKRQRIYYHLEPAGRDYLATVSQQYRQVNQGIARFFERLNGAGEGDLP
ncbi:MAG: PadR family transcriptional regulator [Clostridiales bacterium]|nr:PadR family transcriptional regulator [Clostridiales bacterium]